jgi:hypothetical protein
MSSERRRKDPIGETPPVSTPSSLAGSDTTPLSRQSKPADAANTQQQPPQWEGVDDILLKVLAFSDVYDEVRTKRVNKRWQTFCDKAVEQNFQPKKKFQTNRELKGAAKKYCRYQKKQMNKFGRTCGFPIGKWEVGEIDDFSSVLADMTTFNEDIGRWNLSRAKTIRHMLKNATSFNKPLHNWDISKVTDIGGVFLRATAFNQPLNTWNTGNVTKSDHAFGGATSFNQPLDAWEMGMQTAWSMFSGATAFNHPLHTWDTSKMEIMYGMFKGATAFNRPIATWDFSSVMTYQSIFSGATAFQHNLPEGWDPESAFF